MKIVRRGKHYAICKGIFFKKYKDLVHGNYWWDEGNHHFTDCWSEDYEMVLNMMKYDIRFLKDSDDLKRS